MRLAVLGSGEYLKRGLEHFAELVAEPADLLVCLAHPKILKAEEIAQYKHGAINFHCGLPNYRGRHPLQWMLIDGVKEIPVAVHRIDEGIDTGDILVSDVIPVDRNETYATALEKVTEKVGPMVLAAINQIESGAVYAQKQPKGRTIRKRTEDDSRFEFCRPSSEIHRFVNALSDPMPNAHCDGVRYQHSYTGSEPGEVVATTTDGRIVVATQDGVVLLELA